MNAAVKYRVYSQDQWIKTTVEGRLDLARSLEVIRTLDDDPSLPTPFDVLIDLRNTPSTEPTEDPGRERPSAT
jgi:hypothetical protein